MIILLQRVSKASVSIAANTIAKISAGLLVFVAAEPNDELVCCERAARKITGYRIFADEAGKMNLSVIDIQGEILLVPQFTLAADTQQGMRPGFSTAASPELAVKLFQQLHTCVKSYGLVVQTGQFGASMDIALVNAGPATFLLRI